MVLFPSFTDWTGAYETLQLTGGAYFRAHDPTYSPVGLIVGCVQAGEWEMWSAVWAYYNHTMLTTFFLCVFENFCNKKLSQTCSYLN